MWFVVLIRRAVPELTMTFDERLRRSLAQALRRRAWHWRCLMSGSIRNGCLQDVSE